MLTQSSALTHTNNSKYTISGLGEERELESLTSPVNILMRTGEGIAFSLTDALTSPKPAVQYEGKSIIFNPEVMDVDRAYPFKMFGRNMAVIKLPDDTMDFYYFPTAAEEESE